MPNTQSSEPEVRTFTWLVGSISSPTEVVIPSKYADVEKILGDDRDSWPRFCTINTEGPLKWHTVLFCRENGELVFVFYNLASTADFIYRASLGEFGWELHAEPSKWLTWAKKDLRDRVIESGFFDGFQ